MSKLYYMDITPLLHPETFAWGLQMVGEVRKKKIAECKNDADKARSLAAGLLFCYGYREYVGAEKGKSVACGGKQPGQRVPEEGLPGPHGKPSAVDGVYYSLSHSGNYAACLIGRRENGLDIQVRRPVREGLEKRFFAKEEKDYLDGLQGSGGAQEVTDAFFTIWTLKEAYAKYTGRGMGEGFADFSVMPSIRRKEYRPEEKHAKGDVLQSGCYGKLDEDCFFAAFLPEEEKCRTAEQIEVFEYILPG